MQGYLSVINVFVVRASVDDVWFLPINLAAQFSSEKSFNFRSTTLAEKRLERVDT
jgi:hypothetical protein